MIERLDPSVKIGGSVNGSSPHGMIDSIKRSPKRSGRYSRLTVSSHRKRELEVQTIPPSNSLQAAIIESINQRGL
ncbi:hypothetical protein Pst134EB_023960 [Puccinia striiformis f. sp. tritici]|nr:hypothetical protein Pst134EB_023960 [Puccinia striiformis f. sp. tritici]